MIRKYLVCQIITVKHIKIIRQFCGFFKSLNKNEQLNIIKK